MMRQQWERPKNNRFNKQNNNFAHAPGFFVHLFSVFEGLNYGENIPNFVFYGERTQATTKFCFAFWTWTWSLGIHIQESLWLHLNERMQINFLRNFLVAVTLCDLKSLVITSPKLRRYSILLGLNESWEMQSACQISRQLDRVLKCDVIKMKFLKLWDLSGYSERTRTMSKGPTYQKWGQSWYIFKSWCTEGGPGQGFQNHCLADTLNH